MLMAEGWMGLMGFVGFLSGWRQTSRNIFTISISFTIESYEYLCNIFIPYFVRLT